MKRITKVYIIIFMLSIFLNYKLIICNAQETDISMDNVLKSQKDNLNISEFLNESKKYSSDIYEDTTIQQLFNESMSGSIKNLGLGRRIIKLLFGEIENAITTLGIVLGAVLIHSLLRCVSEGLNNSSVSKIAYFVTYIFIVTIIMKNFSEIIVIMKTSIENLVGFINCLLPVLVTLLIASGGIVTGVGMQTTILFAVTFFSNIITKIIIPFSLIAITLDIVSNISSKVQLKRLSKFINSSIVWMLGILLTIFVGITSLEGTIGKRSRSGNSQNYQGCCVIGNSNCRKNIAEIQLKW